MSHRSVEPAEASLAFAVATHFHFDHLAGIRNYIAEGATIVTTPSAKRIIETRAARGARTMRPDRLAQAPRTPTIEVVEGRRVFEGGGIKLEVIEIGPSPHVAEMLVGYLKAQRLLFEADVLDIAADGDTPSGGDDTRDLESKIEKLGLDVERIVPVHGRLGTIEDLRRAVVSRPNEGAAR